MKIKILENFQAVKNSLSGPGVKREMERCSWATAKVAATPLRQQVNTMPASHFYTQRMVY
ncbi:MAG TPA: hypothetical protein VJT54_11830 [Verrucomicrobiae bacterium]|nr:hypothetical protein [Verrucomicrobiae bacterium]